MIYLVLTILQSTLIFITFRFFNNFRISNVQAIVVNYIVAAAFGFLVYPGDYTIGGLPQINWFWLAVILGVFFILVFNVFALSAQKVGVALTSVASKMSVIIPVSLGVIVYDDDMGLMKAMGILSALTAFYLTLKKGRQEKIDYRFIILPVLLFLGNGTVDSLMKFAQHFYITSDLILFLSVVFATSFVLGSLFFAIWSTKNKIKWQIKNIIAGVFLGLINFGSTYYLIRAMTVFESSVVFPVTNAGIVSLSALSGLIIFRERLSVVNWAGIILSIIAILLIAQG